MNTKKTSNYMGNDIFALTFSVKMTDIADVLTYTRFCKKFLDINVVNDPVPPYGYLRNNEEKVLFINKSLAFDIPTSDFTPSDKRGYALLGASDDLSYLNYYLNTFWGKYQLSSGKISPHKIHTINLSSIKELEVIRNREIEPSCVYLQKVIDYLDIFLGKTGDDELTKTTIIRCFKTISNTIIFEISLPNAFAEYEISLIEEWVKLVNQVSSEGNLDAQIHMLIKNIFNINSPILDSINRMKTFGPQIIDSALNKILGGIKS